MIRLEQVTKVFPGGVEAVKDVSLQIEESETFVLIGLSGCGKTTTLKMINRLIEPTSGNIFIADSNILHENPYTLRRRIGYVIQDVGLFPHMSVGANISIVLRLLGEPLSRRRERAAELLELVELPADEYLDRYPRELSGGQQQRVGVARALAADPPVLLMDEPFGALDPITREQLQQDFISLEEHIQKTIVMVTHDIFEAVLLGDRIGIMSEGSMMQVATPEELLERPANEFVQRFLGRHRFQLQLTTLAASESAVSGEDARVGSAPADATVQQARRRLDQQGLVAMVVQDEEQGVVGTVAAEDLQKAEDNTAPLVGLADENGPVLQHDASVLDVVRAFAESGHSFVPVVDEHNGLLGVATRARTAAAVNEALGLGPADTEDSA